MQTLQEKAAEWSGVDHEDAFAIDQTNLYQKLGLQTFINLSTDFYTSTFALTRTPARGFPSGIGVYEDEEEWFRSIFADSKKEDAIQNQYEFFVQRMGGPPLFSQRKGHPALIGRHRPFEVTHKAAERWLHHMHQALDNATDIDHDSKTRMLNFFRHTAYFLVAGNDLKNQSQGAPPSLAEGLSYKKDQLKFYCCEPFKDIKNILIQRTMPPRQINRSAIEQLIADRVIEAVAATLAQHEADSVTP
nr:two-on-two hemoglobin-3 [Tanacetum cinerariifolium]